MYYYKFKNVSMLAVHSFEIATDSAEDGYDDKDIKAFVYASSESTLHMYRRWK